MIANLSVKCLLSILLFFFSFFPFFFLDSYMAKTKKKDLKNWTTHFVGRKWKKSQHNFFSCHKDICRKGKTVKFHKTKTVMLKLTCSSCLCWALLPLSQPTCRVKSYQLEREATVHPETFLLMSGIQRELGNSCDSHQIQSKMLPNKQIMFKLWQSVSHFNFFFFKKKKEENGYLIL